MELAEINKIVADFKKLTKNKERIEFIERLTDEQKDSPDFIHARIFPENGKVVVEVFDAKETIVNEAFPDATTASSIYRKYAEKVGMKNRDKYKMCTVVNISDKEFYYFDVTKNPRLK